MGPVKRILRRVEMFVSAIMDIILQRLQTLLRKKSVKFALNFVGLALEGRLLTVARASTPTWRRRRMGAVDVRMGNTSQGPAV